MKTLVVGLGIGRLYERVNKELGHTVITCDSNPSTNPDFTSVVDAIAAHKFFDTAHICVPNFLHGPVSEQIAPHCGIVFVEKPGLKTPYQWWRLTNLYPQTHFMMVKNNQYRLDNGRSGINELCALAQRSKIITLYWVHKNRIPFPGSWFTTREKSFGGVSRDLFPHLLSYVAAFDKQIYMNDVDYELCEVRRWWDLSGITSTEYGIINRNGTYDVDDSVNVIFEFNARTYQLVANWKTADGDYQAIEFDIPGIPKIAVPLGLCPESAYKEMVSSAIANQNNQQFWEQQKFQDMWIHQKIQDIR